MYSMKNDVDIQKPVKEQLDGSGSSTDAKGVVLKKGRWTYAEDEMLIDFVKKHENKNWNDVQKKTRLRRGGKSCRLRWENHLRPNLKKGEFTREEKQLIIQMHAKIGKKWSQIAAYLPGRTDNAIKNFWNTQDKKMQRTNLPLHSPSDQFFHGEIQRTIYERPPMLSQNTFKELPRFSCDIPGSHASSNGNFFSAFSSLCAGAVKLELPSLQWPETRDCNGLLEALVQESSKMSSGRKQYCSERSSCSSAITLLDDMMDTAAVNFCNDGLDDETGETNTQATVSGSSSGTMTGEQISTTKP